MMPESEFDEFSAGVYVQQIMLYKRTGEVGVVEEVEPSQTGLPGRIVLRLKDGSLRKGPLSDFEHPNGEQRSAYLE